MSNPEALNSPDDGGVPDGAKPNTDHVMDKARLKATLHVCGQDRALRIPRRSQNKAPETPEAG
jgi:hypothetical protein